MLPAQQVTRTGSCTGTVIGVSKTFYGGLSFQGTDGGFDVALNAVTQDIPATGFMPVPTASLTRTQNWDGGSSPDHLNRWLVARTTYDTVGRPVKVFSPNELSRQLTDRASTEFTYDSVSGYQNSAVFRPNPAAVNGGLAMTVSVVLDPATGQPSKSTDQNGNTTYTCYDTIGRTTAIYAPRLSGEPAGVNPSWNPCVETGSLDVPDVTYTYSIGAYLTGTPVLRSKKYPTVVTTSALADFGTHTADDEKTTANDRRVDSVVYIDGNGRARETQTYSPTAGKLIITAGMTDERGNAYRAIDPFAIAHDSPGDYTSPVNGLNGFTTWPATPAVDYRLTVSTFDTVNRATNVTVKWKPVGGSQDLLTTSTVYEGVRTLVDPQIGASTATTVDALGRTVSTEVLSTPSATTDYSYSYTLGVPTDTDALRVATPANTTGWLTTTMTDDADNVTTTVADLAGRTYRSEEPNAGVSWFAYDANGNVTATKDATHTSGASAVINTTYDV